MKEFLIIVGVLIIGIGVLFSLGMNGGVTILPISLFAGALLLGMSRIIALLERMNSKLAPIPLSDSHLAELICNAHEYETMSTHLEIFPTNEYPYPVFVLEGHYYMPIEFLSNYYEQQEDTIIFTLPNQAPIQLKKSDKYYKSVSLLQFEGELYVCLHKLGLTILLAEGKAVLSSDSSS